MLRIKELIKLKGYSVTSLAAKLGITQVSLSRIINGNPTVDTLKKIADALGVQVVDLFVPSKEENAYTLYIEKKDGDISPLGVIKLDDSLYSEEE